MKRTGKSGGISHDEIRVQYLKDSKQADFALNLALKEFEVDGDFNALLDTLRLIAQAQGGIAKLARETSITRKALHEALSPKGNPRLRTFQSVLGSLGLQMSVKPLRRTTQKVSSAA
jgi:probable addiction module antidote protein